MRYSFKNSAIIHFKALKSFDIVNPSLNNFRSGVKTLNEKIPDKTIERLSLYRRLLTYELIQNRENIYSHEIAQLACLSSAQVRRDLMVLEHIGNPRKGYKVSQIIEQISAILGKTKVQKIAIFGVGNLGRAILSYFSGKMLDLPIVAAFDTSLEKTDRVICGCHVYHVSNFEEIFKKDNISIVILAVPVSAAQEIVDMLIPMGVCAFINFAHVPLKVPENIFVENIDIMLTIEKAAYFAIQNRDR